MKKHIQDEITAFANKAVDNKLLIDTGFLGFRMAVLPLNAAPAQVEAMRAAFFAGASHVFSTIINMLDPGEEATEQDFKRLDNIQAELEKFMSDFELQNLKTEGKS